MELSHYPWLLELNEELKQFVSDDIIIKVVSEDWERRQYYRLREATFRDEQKILKEDRDEYDFNALGIVAIGNMFGEHDRVVGAVRIFPMAKIHGGVGAYVSSLCIATIMLLVRL